MTLKLKLPKLRKIGLENPEESDAVKQLCPEWTQECLNFDTNEKRLIIKSAIRCKNDKEKMAVFLEITLRSLYDRILFHGLQDKI
jgi:hypothetical protein